MIGGSYYAEGGLWFRDGKLIDYDGIFALPNEIREQIRKFGYQVD